MSTGPRATPDVPGDAVARLGAHSPSPQNELDGWTPPRFPSSGNALRSGEQLEASSACPSAAMRGHHGAQLAGDCDPALTVLHGTRETGDRRIWKASVGSTNATWHAGEDELSSRRGLRESTRDSLTRSGLSPGGRHGRRRRQHSSEHGRPPPSAQASPPHATTPRHLLPRPHPPSTPARLRCPTTTPCRPWRGGGGGGPCRSGRASWWQRAVMRPSCGAWR